MRTFDARSGITQTNLQEIVDEAISVKAATLNGQQQYQTPRAWAEYLAKLLPTTRASFVFDPQVAEGSLFEGFSLLAERFGFEIDKRTADRRDGVRRLIGNCVKLWDLLDELSHDLRFECQVANPPFAVKWGVASGEWRVASEAGRGTEMRRGSGEQWSLSVLSGLCGLYVAQDSGTGLSRRVRLLHRRAVHAGAVGHRGPTVRVHVPDGSARFLPTDGRGSGRGPLVAGQDHRYVLPENWTGD